MSTDLPVDDAIEEICDGFEAKWKAGESPRIEDFLDESHRGALQLFRELLLVEVAYRRKNGELPDGKDYQQRFPDHVDIVRQVFHGDSGGDIRTADLSTASTELERMAAAMRASMSVKARQSRFREHAVKRPTSSVSEPGVLYRSKKAVCETTNRTLKPLSVGMASDTSNKDFAECHGRSDIASGARIGSRSPPPWRRDGAKPGSSSLT